MINTPEPKQSLEGLAGRHRRIQRLRHHIAVLDDQLLIKRVVLVEIELRQHLQAHKPGRPDKVGNRNRGYEDQCTLRSDPARIPPQHDARVLLGKRRLEAIELRTQPAPLRDRSLRPWPWTPVRLPGPPPSRPPIGQT